MRNIFNWVTWLTAVGLAILLTLIQFGFAVMFDDYGRLTLFWIVASVIISVASQSGLFLAPWVVSWKVRYKILVALLMLPSIWMLLGEFSEDLGIGFDGHSLRQPSEHVLELVVILAILAVYTGQLVRVVSCLVNRRHITG